MTPEAKRDIEQLVERIDPASVLVIETRDNRLLNAYVQSRPKTQLTRLNAEEAATRLAKGGRHDMAVMIEPLDTLDKKHAEQLLSGLRDLYSRRLLVLTPAADAGNTTQCWRSADLIAFGLSELRDYDNGERLFEYNILNYKQTPDWLNPRNWANPEMWDKFRW